MTQTLWDWYESTTDDRTALSPLERQVAAVCDLRHEVGAGGFDGYFSYCCGDSLADALEGLPTLLGPDWAVVLQEAMSQLGTPFPHDWRTREQMLLDDGVCDSLDPMDRRLYELEHSVDADALLVEALRASHTFSHALKA